MAIPDVSGAVVGFDQAMGYNLGMKAARLIRNHAPAFYASHVAPLPATLEGAAGLCGAFWHLIEETYGITLRWPPVRWYLSYGGDSLRDQLECDTAAEWLDVFDDVDPEWLNELWFWLDEVRPHYHGLGVQGRVAGDMEPPSTLTLLLWHMFSATRVSVGTDLLETFHRHTSDDRLLELKKIQPLPATFDASTVMAEVAHAIPEAQTLPRPSDILRYVFGCTRNPLADTASEEIDAVYGGEDIHVWDWKNIADLARQQREAAAIADAYTAWRDRIDDGGLPALRQVAAHIHRTARRVRHERRDSESTLITLLTGHTTAEPVRELVWT